VNFKIRTPDGIESGKGKLHVEPCEGGLVRAAISVFHKGEVKIVGDVVTAQASKEYFSLSQQAVDAITKSPTGANTDYVLDMTANNPPPLTGGK
jgi:hypothetical protein